MRDLRLPRSGPFELIDLAGLDINLAASRGIWEGLGRPERLRPSAMLGRLIGDGRLGRKSGRGFYRYESGRRGPVEPEFADRRTTLAAAEIRGRILAAIDDEARHVVERRGRDRARDTSTSPCASAPATRPVRSNGRRRLQSSR